jgi:ribosomal protein S27AE
MNTSVSDFHKLTLDGQQFNLPRGRTWDDIIESGTWNGLPVFFPRTKHIVVEMLRFTREHAEAFSLGLCMHGPRAKMWTWMTLFGLDAQPRRVHIERARCEACGAMQVIANPEAAELFLGVEARDEAVARARQAARVSCGRCAAELPRPAVWTELLSPA